MEDLSATTPSSQATLCNACFKHVNTEDTFCDNCGYPLKGSEQEQNNFIYNRNNKEIDLDEANKKIEKAGNILFWIAGATFLTGIVFYFIQKDNDDAFGLLITNLILTLIYTALGAWSKKKPLAAIISGLALYVIILLLNAFENPATIISGLFLKIFFIACFIKGIRSAIEAEQLKKELNIE